MSMTSEDKEVLERVADVMLRVGKQLFARGTVQDAVSWDDPVSGLRVAWVMKPEKMPNAGVAQDRQTPFRGPYAARIFQMEGMDGRTFEYEREMDMGDFLPRVANELYSLSDDEPVGVTMIPEPGYPWPAPDGYYSAKKKKWLDSPRPDWLFPENIVDPARHVDSPGLNICKLLSEPLDYEMGAEVVRYGTRDDDFFMVTHAMGSIEGMTRFGGAGGDVSGWEANAEKVMECGGLIFPSLAIGPIPATNFGVGVLIADAGVVLNSLKPYLKRGTKAPSLVYSSDAWTERTSSLFTDSAVAAFEQMHGHSEYMYYVDQNVWPLGAPRAWALWGPGELAEEVHKVTTLKRELKERFRLWTRDMSPEEVEELQEEVASTKARYGYLEAKVNGVMAIGEFPYAVVPPQQEEGFRRFLDMTGFEGELIVVELPDELLEVIATDWSPPGISFERRQAIIAWANMEYGWHVADAVRKVAREMSL